MLQIWTCLRARAATNSQDAAVFFGGPHVFVAQTDSLFCMQPRKLLKYPGLLSWMSQYSTVKFG